jgi:hypothetical protein
MIYDTWHSYIGAPHHVSADVDSEYFGKRKWKCGNKSLYQELQGMVQLK